MYQSIDKPDKTVAPQTVMPVIGYAEPSTWAYNRRPNRHGLYKLAGFVTLMFGVVFIGATLGSIFIDLVPARPWAGHIVVRIGQGPISPGELAAIRHDRDQIAAQPLAEVFPPAALQPWAFVPENEFTQAVKISQVQADGSFMVDLSGKTEQQCNRLIADYSNMPLQMPSFRGRPFQVSYEGSAMTAAAANAPMKSTMIGASGGLLADLIYLLMRVRRVRKSASRKKAMQAS